jgi:hypothetical protein
MDNIMEHQDFSVTVTATVTDYGSRPTGHGIFISRRETEDAPVLAKIPSPSRRTILKRFWRAGEETVLQNS